MGKRKVILTNRVRDCRTNAGGMTQQQLADLVGVTRQSTFCRVALRRDRDPKA
jgi:hypothetical protein